MSKTGRRACKPPASAADTLTCGPAGWTVMIYSCSLALYQAVEKAPAAASTLGRSECGALRYYLRGMNRSAEDFADCNDQI